MSTLKYLKEYIRFLRNSKNIDIVFYSESESYYIYFKSIISTLVENYSINICYVTSSNKDPLLTNTNKKFSVYNIGSKTIRTIFFATLDVKVVVMTMPDLHNYHIKRSNNSVHYVYLPHSLLSTHMVYRKGAFDFYDSFFCVGFHHLKELRASEKLYESKCKKLFKIGYPRLDDLISSNPINKRPYSTLKQIIITPSWYSPGIIETCCDELIQNLLSIDFKVVLRPHRDSKKLFPDKLNYIYEKFKEYKNFKLVYDDINNIELKKSAILITDWSGAAMSFAFGLCRPVISIDLPKKINNIDFDKYDIGPFETEIRSEIGSIVNPKNINRICEVIDNLMDNSDKISKKLELLRREKIFNLGKSAEIGAKYLSKLVNKSLI
ncbi:MAG: hypothetical protein CMF99_06495 [Candidatus Marinimicrobia bacterium]|nr:hypothetical protein [Candidatus Neomarinimicrobiota bacterium]